MEEVITVESVLDRVSRVICHSLEDDGLIITDETRLIEGLGCDRIDLADILFTLDMYYGVDIMSADEQHHLSNNPSELNKLTVGDLVRRILEEIQR